MSDLLIRRLSPEDSLEDITALLHRAFAPLGRLGLTCSCIAQSTATTASRIARGTCFVALHGRRIVGTVTVERPDPAHECAWYRRPRTASVHQLGVEPELQQRGCGTQLLRVAERWAAAQGCDELALDTPRRARHLVAWYRAHGFAPLADVRQPGRDYRSVVLAKPVAQTTPLVAMWRAPHRTFPDVVAR